jgi:acetyl-CoA C-acetyltransferase
MPEAVIVATGRSPIGRANKGRMRDVRPDDLGATVATDLLASLPELDPGEIDDLLVGCGNPGGEQGFNLGRVVGVLAGLDEVPGTTVARYCASSLQATRMAFHAIRAGEGDAYLVLGVETVSRFVKGSSDRIPETKNPRFEPAAARTMARFARTGREAWTSARTTDGLPDVYIGMGLTAENVAQLEGVARTDQDAWAATSQARYQQALETGYWDTEITPLRLPDGTLLDHDESPRPGTTAEALATLDPVFVEDGTVTAGNACPLNDGAAGLVVMSDTRAAELGIAPLARIVATGVAALDPEVMGLAPIEATRRALKQAGMTMADIDLVELNEAFAAQVLPCQRHLEIDPERCNVHGGAIALGHPFGMTGARIVGTLVRSLAWRDEQVGLATLCVSGGQGMALVVERTS